MVHALSRTLSEEYYPGAQISLIRVKRSAKDASSKKSMGAGATTSAVSNPRFSVSFGFLYLPPSKISYADLNVDVIFNIASHSWTSWTEEDEDDDDDAMLMTLDAAAMVGMTMLIHCLASI